MISAKNSGAFEPILKARNNALKEIENIETGYWDSYREDFKQQISSLRPAIDNVWKMFDAGMKIGTAEKFDPNQTLEKLKANSADVGAKMDQLMKNANTSLAFIEKIITQLGDKTFQESVVTDQGWASFIEKAVSSPLQGIADVGTSIYNYFAGGKTNEKAKALPFDVSPFSTTLDRLRHSLISYRTAALNVYKSLAASQRAGLKSFELNDNTIESVRELIKGETGAKTDAAEGFGSLSEPSPTPQAQPKVPQVQQVQRKVHPDDV
jgi:cytochrome c556